MALTRSVTLIAGSLASMLLTSAQSDAKVAQSSRTICAGFHQPFYSFPGMERDYADSIVFINTGDSNGEGFLIDAARRYYLTARHVVDAAISNPNLAITGRDHLGNTLKLIVLDSDSKLDIALLAADNSYPTSDKMPFDLYLDVVAEDTLVSFSGLAFANARDVSATSPSPNNFAYSNDMDMLLKVNTNDGDSGAPLYTAQGLVVGVIERKQTIAQGVALPTTKLVTFLERHLGSNSANSIRNLLVNTKDIALLKDKLKPHHSIGGISNLDLDGAIVMMLDDDDLKNIDSSIVYCPIIPAVRQRGLQSAAERLEVVEADIAAEQDSGGATQKMANPQVSPPAKPKASVHGSAEKIGDTLLKRAELYKEDGDARFARTLYADASKSFLSAISENLNSEDRNNYLTAFTSPSLSEEANKENMAKIAVKFDGAKNVNLIDQEAVVSQISKFTQENTFYGKDVYETNNYNKIFSERTTLGARPEETDKRDKFAALLNKYYVATAGAVGLDTVNLEVELTLGKKVHKTDLDAAIKKLYDLKAPDQLRAAAAWAALTSTSPPQKANSYLDAGDALVLSDRADEAAKFYAEAYRTNAQSGVVSTINDIALKSYAATKFSDINTVPSDRVLIKAIQSERPVSIDDVISVGVSLDKAGYIK